LCPSNQALALNANSDNIDVAKTEIPQRLHEIVQTLVKEDDLNRLQSTVSTPKYRIFWFF